MLARTRYTNSNPQTGANVLRFWGLSHCSPPDSIQHEFFNPSDETTRRPWKGTASYYDIEVGGKTNPATAWFYTEPKDAAKQIRDHAAFWRGVQAEGQPTPFTSTGTPRPLRRETVSRTWRQAWRWVAGVARPPRCGRTCRLRSRPSRRVRSR